MKPRIAVAVAAIVSTSLFTIFSSADTPPSSRVSSRTQDGQGAPITSTTAGGKTALDVAIPSGISANVSSSASAPLFTQPVFGGSAVDPRARTWSLLNSSDSVTAFQGGSWTFGLPSGASTSALQTDGNTLLSSINSKLVAPSGLLRVDGSQVTQPVSGSVSVSNFPSIQQVQGSVNVSNFPSSQQVTGNLGRNWTLSSSTDSVAISGSVTANNSSVSATGVTAPASATQMGAQDGTGKLQPLALTANGLKVDGSAVTQPVSGSVSIAGTPSVSVSNFPATQPVSGTVGISGTVPVSGPLTDAQLRATPVPVSGSVSLSGSPSVSVSNFPATQPVSGTVAVSNLPATQTVSGSVSVSNLPATQAVSAVSLPLPSGAATESTLSSLNGKVSTTANGIKVDGSTVTQPISGTVSVSGTVPVSGPLTDAQLRASAVPVSGSVAVSNFPASQTVSGTVGVSSLPSLPAGSNAIGSVSVSNFPATQAVSAASLPLPTGAATESTLSALNGKVTTTLNGVKVDGSGVTQPVSGSVSVSNFPATQAISAASLPLPTGAATAANQATANSSLSSIDSKLSGTLSVSGPLTDTQLRASAVPVSASSLPLPSGAATAANQVTTNASLSSIDVKTPALVSGRVPVDGSGVTQPVSGSVTVTSLPAVSGTVSVSNFPATQPVSATSLPLPTGAATDATLATVATNTANIPAPVSGVPNYTSAGVPVKAVPPTTFRTTFARTIASGVDSNFFSVVATGSGQTVAQSSGNLVLNAGTTANAEIVLRSTQSFQNSLVLKYAMQLSQRILNNNFFVELVDVIGDGLAVTVNSSTSITVTIPSNPFDSTNVGQSVYVGAVSGIPGAVPGRYAIASISGNNVNFTVSGWPATGSGTASLFGWNYHQALYSGTSATQAQYDTQRRGWNTGFSTVTVSTTATGHLGIMTQEYGQAAYLDQTLASATSAQVTQRASRVANIPEETTPLFIQIRAVNGSTAPASATTATIGLVALESYAPTYVSLANARPQPLTAPAPVNVVTGSIGSVTTLSTVTASNGAAPTAVSDVASAALTTTTTTAAITPSAGISYQVQIPVTAVAGTNATLDVQIQESRDGGTNWIPVFDFPRITAIGSYSSPLLPLTGNRVRYVQTVNGTGPSFTRAVNRLQSTQIAPTVRQMIDRTIAPNTLNSATATLAAENNTNNVQMILSLAAGGTAPSVQLQGSDDLGATWYSIGSPLAGTAGATVQASFTAQSSTLYRAVVSSAGSGATLNYLLLRAF